jgi:hypothetical protein
MKIKARKKIRLAICNFFFMDVHSNSFQCTTVLNRTITQSFPHLLPINTLMQFFNNLILCQSKVNMTAKAICQFKISIKNRGELS